MRPSGISRRNDGPLEQRRFDDASFARHRHRARLLTSTWSNPDAWRDRARPSSDRVSEFASWNSEDVKGFAERPKLRLETTRQELRQKSFQTRFAFCHVSQTRACPREMSGLKQVAARGKVV